MKYLGVADQRCDLTRIRFQALAHSQARKDSYYLGFLNTLRIRTLVAQAEAITPLGDLNDFAELAG